MKHHRNMTYKTGAILLIAAALLSASGCTSGTPRQTSGVQASEPQTIEAQASKSRTPESQAFEPQTIEAQVIETEASPSVQLASNQIPRSYTPEDSAYDNLAVANVTSALNLRSEPSTESKVLGTCYRGGGGTILEQKNGWTKIRSGNLEGWLKDDYLVFGSNIKPLAKELGLFNAKVTTQTLNIREQPDTSAPIIGLAASEDYYPVLSEENGWAKIQLSADTTGYVSCDYVSIRVTPGRIVSIEAIEAELAALEKEEKESKKTASKKEEKKESPKPSYVISASEDDIYLMASCIAMEAGGYSYESQVAVGNVIVNRVKSGQWGGSISDVIYAPGQFPGATSGLLDKYISQGPSSSCMKAAKAALSGENQIGDYLYFTSTKSAAYDSYSNYTVVGGNCFYKK